MVKEVVEEVEEVEEEEGEEGGMAILWEGFGGILVVSRWCSWDGRRVNDGEWNVVSCGVGDEGGEGFGR